MKNKPSTPLVVLNACLLTLVVTLGVVRSVNADAPAQPDRAHGSYTMVSGAVQGGSNDVAYVIDTVNQELVSVGWDIAKNQLYVIGYRNLVADAKQHGNR
jgi:hypothetical protein